MTPASLQERTRPTGVTDDVLEEPTAMHKNNATNVCFGVQEVTVRNKSIYQENTPEIFTEAAYLLELW